MGIIEKTQTTAEGFLLIKKKGLLKGGDPSAHYGTSFQIDNLVNKIVGGTHFPVLLKNYIPP